MLSIPTLDIKLFQIVLLHGCSGVGKTKLVQLIAEGEGWNFAAIKGSDIYNKYLGESEQSVKKLFDEAREAQPCVLFLDEAEGILSSRVTSNDADNGSSLRVKTEFLEHIQNVENSTDNILIVLASNWPGRLDEAIVKRAGLHLHLELPQPEDMAEMIKTWLNDSQFEHEISDHFLRSFSRELENYSFRYRNNVLIFQRK